MRVLSLDPAIPISTRQPRFATALARLTDLPVGNVAHAVNESGQVTGDSLTGAFLLTGNSFREWDGFGSYGINNLGQLSGNEQQTNPYRPTPLPLAPAIYNGSKWEVMDIAQLYPRGTRDGVYADLHFLLDLNDTGYAVGRKSRYGLAGSSAILIEPPYSAVLSSA